MSTALATATVDDLLSWRPCSAWPADRIRKVARKRRRRWTAEHVLGLRSVSAQHKLWVVLRPGLLPDWVLRLFAADCAVRALIRERRAGREPDPRSWEAVRVARDFALGRATQEELIAAWAAAGAAGAAAEKSKQVERLAGLLRWAREDGRLT